MKKKEHFAKHLTVHKILVDFLELSVFVNCFFTLNILFSEVDRKFNIEKNILSDTI